MLTWWEITFFDSAFVCETLFAFKEKFFAFTATLTALRIEISSQGISPIKSCCLIAAY
jgi:hypothetical protein